MAEDFYVKCGSILAATKAKDQEEALSAYEDAVESLDALLDAFKMPTVANATEEKYGFLCAALVIKIPNIIVISADSAVAP